MSLYQDSIVNARERLTQVVPLLQDPNPTAPVSRLDDVDIYLGKHNCLVETDFTTCYKLTMLMLINTTNDLDKANERIYAGQVTVNSLINNINVLIDSLNTTLDNKVK